MRELTFREAINEALAEEMERDESVILFGEDVGPFGGAFQVASGLYQRFGADRVRDTPISESAIMGCALGSSVTGMRPVAEIMFSDFMMVGADQLVNQIAKMRYMSGGQVKCPLVIRTTTGAGLAAAAQHSQCIESIFLSFPGLKLVLPSTPCDAKGLLKSAIRDDNPVIFFEHKVLYGIKGEVPEGEYTIPLGKAEIKREGSDVTIIASMNLLHKAMLAAEMLSTESVGAEVIDIRTLVPLDREMLIASVKKTGRLVIASEGHCSGGIGSEIAAIMCDEVFDYLHAPIKRVASLDVPIPFNPRLEKFVTPDETNIIEAVKGILRA